MCLFVQVVKMAHSQDWWCWTPSFMTYRTPSDVTGINVSVTCCQAQCSYITKGSILLAGYNHYYTCWLGWWWLITLFQAFPVVWSIFAYFERPKNDSGKALEWSKPQVVNFQTKWHCCDPPFSLLRNPIPILSCHVPLWMCSIITSHDLLFQ